MAAQAAAVGRRLLSETHETSLEELLRHIRAEVVSAVPDAPPAQYPLPALEQIVAAHFRDTRTTGLEIAGRNALALVYFLVAAVVSPPCRQAVVVVDLENRFDPSALLRLVAESGHCVAPADLRHVHVFRVDPRVASSLADAVAAAEQRVLYGRQQLRDRPCWGTLVVGGTNLGAASASAGPVVSVMGRTGLYGWLQVDEDREDDEENLQKLQQQLLSREFTALNLPKQITWTASSPWGSFSFQLKRSDEPIQDEIQ